MSSQAAAPRRQLGQSDLWVSPVALGCWPLAGITSVIDSQRDCIETIQAAVQAGINFFDTAYSYGYDGQSDRLLSEALGSQRDQVIIASKVGMHWNAARERVLDASPATLLDHAAQVLRRLQVDAVDIMYLHTPDGTTPIEVSAEAIAKIVDRGWARYAAVSNVDADQAARFHAVCPVIAVQPHFNMLQQESVANLRAFCRRHSISLACYWVLMKGLLAGHLQRDHQFDPKDSRLKYDIFRGEAWQRNQDLVDRLRQLASRTGYSVSQLVIAWTLAQPDITVALCGAKRPAQIRDNAGAMLITLDHATLAEIDGYVAQHGAVR